MILETQKSIKELLKGGVQNKKFSFKGKKGIFEVEFIEKQSGMYFQINNFKGINLFESNFFTSKKDMLLKKLFPEMIKLGFKESENAIIKTVTKKFDIPTFEKTLSDEDGKIILKNLLDVTIHGNDPYFDEIDQVIDSELEDFKKEGKNFFEFRDKLIEVLKETFYFNTTFNHWCPNGIYPNSGFDKRDIVSAGTSIESSFNRILKTNVKLMKRCNVCGKVLIWDKDFEKYICPARYCSFNENN